MPQQEAETAICVFITVSSSYTGSRYVVHMNDISAIGGFYSDDFFSLDKQKVRHISIFVTGSDLLTKCHTFRPHDEYLHHV